MTMNEFDNDMENQELIDDHGVNEDAYELNEEVGPPDLPAPKAKRVLTEAQRLAFMKGRQKMEMNRALKKQKLELMKEDVPEPAAAPRRARSTKPKAVMEVPPVVSPPKPILQRSKAVPNAPPVDDGLGDDMTDIPAPKYYHDPDETAKKIAQMVLEQMKTVSVDVPDGPVKKPRARRPPNKATRPASAPRARKVASPSPSPEAYSDNEMITQRSFNWM